MKISISTPNGGAEPVLAKILRAVAAKVVAAVRQRRRRRAHLRQLNQLLERDDVFLRDMGVSRYEVLNRVAELHRLI